MIGNRILACVRQAARWLRRQRFQKDLEAEGLRLVAEVTLPESLDALRDTAEHGRTIAAQRWPLISLRTRRDGECERRAPRPGDAADRRPLGALLCYERSDLELTPVLFRRGRRGLERGPTRQGRGKLNGV